MSTIDVEDYTIRIPWQIILHLQVSREMTVLESVLAYVMADINRKNKIVVTPFQHSVTNEGVVVTTKTIPIYEDYSYHSRY